MRNSSVHTIGSPLISAWLLSCALAVPASAQHFSEWSTPQSVGPVVNSPHGDRHPAISKDGLTLYFTSDRPGGLGGDDIWVSHRADLDDPWGQAQVLGSSINTAATEYAPTLSRDQHWLLFISTRPGGFGGEDIWASYREHTHSDDWQLAKNLGPAINSAYGDGGPTLLQDGDTGTVALYFASDRPGGVGDLDIWASVMNSDGTFGPATNVAELNSPGRDSRTSIRGDGREIILTSNRAGGEGGLDLWVSTRAISDQTWATPVNLGPLVNGTSNDGAPALSRNGTTLYFYSNRPGGAGGNDLYVAARNKISPGHEEP
jgi:WD40-like Beta Propeller Repeat